MRYEELIDLCKDKQSVFDYLLQKKLIADLHGEICKKESCDGRIRLRREKKIDGFTYRCSKKNCGFRQSIRHNSYFTDSKLPLGTILKFCYFWVNRIESNFIKYELQIGSDNTVVDWKNFCREVCVEYLFRSSEKIGGPGKIVEIDESKFGKRKYNRGRRVDGVWVFGGIERESGRMFLEAVPDRTSATLIPIIKKYVLPETTIYSDCWKSYDCLVREGYLHGTVNHSIEFVSEAGVCTNKIESTWRAVKSSLPRTGTTKDLYDSYFAEYIVRKRFFTDRSTQFEFF